MPPDAGIQIREDPLPLPEHPQRPVLPPIGPSSLGRMFSAFRHYNFRVYFVGLLISVLGVWAQNVAQSWLVYRLTDSALVLGQVSFIVAIPVWLLSPWAGVVLDRVPRRAVLIITQIVFMIQATALALLDFSGIIMVWHIMALSAVQGIANAFDAPARQAFVVELVGKEDMSNGIALNSTMMSLARTFGPAIGGVIVAALGTAWGFTVNAVTYLAILVGLLMLRLDRPTPRPARRSPIQDLAQGLRYIGSSRAIIALMVIALSIALFGGNFTVLMPVFAVEVLGKSAVEFGVLSGAVGLGAVLGALTVAYLSSQPGRGRFLNLVNMLFPIMLALFALSRSFWLSLVLLVLTGMTFMPQLSLCNMLIQSTITDDVRGRVMSVYTLMIFGAFPVGGLIAGALAEALGAPTAIAISAAAVALVSVTLHLVVPELKDLE
ncbi:MAG: MFS transporter [Anaerolineae bacterium]